MAASDYILALRERLGHDLLLLPAVNALIRDEAGRVLLQRRADNGRWCLPGGLMDPGEHPAQSLVREIREETGLLVRPVRVVSVETHNEHRYPNDDLIQGVVIVFECMLVDGTLRIGDEEAIDHRFVDPADVPDCLLETLPGVLEGVQQPAFRWEDRWLDGL